MYALAGGPPFRPGLMREANGVALPVEVWAVPREQFENDRFPKQKGVSNAPSRPEGKL